MTGPPYLATTSPLVPNHPVTPNHAVVEFLRRSDAYADRPTQVQWLETHISWVFLTDFHAYKLKKPVMFEFLDFSTIERRRAACEEEMRINIRLAPDVYLGVLPITQEASGELKLAGSGPPVDWVIKMQRLPAEMALDRLLENGQLRAAQIESLTKKLLDFYLKLPALSLEADSYRLEFERHVLANRQELLQPVHGLDPAAVKRVHAAQLRLLRTSPGLLDSRVLNGRIIEGHGDLRPEHIYFCPEPVVIDGIEFNADMRRLDVLDELSFLAMECTALGAADIGNGIVSAYCVAAKDDPPPRLLPFYETYRACVRSKVAALRAHQLSGNEQRTASASAARYLELADHYATVLGRPLLLIVWGLSGTGKSVVATELARLLGCELLQTDALRRELLGASERPVPFGADNYSVANRQWIYDELFRRADAMLANGLSVVLDGTFLRADQRAQGAALAFRHSVDVLLVSCECPDAVALERIRHRLDTGDSLSEFRPDLFVWQRRSLERDAIDVPACDVITTDSLSNMTEKVFACIERLAAPPRTRV